MVSAGGSASRGAGVHGGVFHIAYVYTRANSRCPARQHGLTHRHASRGQDDGTFRFVTYGDIGSVQVPHTGERRRQRIQQVRAV